jgi:intergrase/recombinase
VGRQPSGRIDFTLRIDKQLYQRLKEISQATGKSIADLLEPKIIELIALYDSSLKKGGDGLARIRTGDIRLVRVSLKDLYNKHRRNFIKYLQNRVKEGKLSDETARDYISALDKNLTHVMHPDELEDLILNTKGDKFAKGVRNFFNYLEDKGITNINGYDLARWRKKAIIRKYGSREIFISDEELKEAYYSHIRKINDEELELVFKLLVFSGLRLKHLWRALQSFNSQNVVKVNEKVIRHPVYSVSRGKKKAYWIYCPSWIKLGKITQEYDYFEE